MIGIRPPSSKKQRLAPWCASLWQPGSQAEVSGVLPLGIAHPPPAGLWSCSGVLAGTLETQDSRIRPPPPPPPPHQNSAQASGCKFAKPPAPLLLPPRPAMKQQEEASCSSSGASSGGSTSTAASSGSSLQNPASNASEDKQEASPAIAQKRCVEEAAVKLEEHLRCSICLDTIAAAHGLPCGHWFCGSCLTDSLKQRSFCPHCRAPSTMHGVKPVARLDDIIEAALELQEAAGLGPSGAVADWQERKRQTADETARALPPKWSKPLPPPGPHWTQYCDQGCLWWYYEGPMGRWWCCKGTEMEMFQYGD
mmetsp:Transcript_34341/g.80370  ORF Transcript_34341/g.80370 Transcript_34341/m.80370 type:complete len:309 (+) Transcript_34341:135-1061(+)